MHYIVFIISNNIKWFSLIFIFWNNKLETNKAERWRKILCFQKSTKGFFTSFPFEFHNRGRLHKLKLFFCAVLLTNQEQRWLNSLEFTDRFFNRKFITNSISIMNLTNFNTFEQRYHFDDLISVCCINTMVISTFFLLEKFAIFPWFAFRLCSSFHLALFNDQMTHGAENKKTLTKSAYI